MHLYYNIGLIIRNTISQKMSKENSLCKNNSFTSFNLLNFDILCYNSTFKVYYSFTIRIKNIIVSSEE